jgi:glycerol kinase
VSRDLILAVDQGTTSTRAVAFSPQLRPVAAAAVPLDTVHPRPGWVEQDPLDIVDSVVEAVGRVLHEVGGPGRIAAAGLDNQGETVVAWDAVTLEPLGPAIVWQCRRSLPIVERLRKAGLEPAIRGHTGLPLDPYYSAGKMAWLLEEVPAVAAAARRGSLRLGTVDAWLTARLDDGRARSDPSTASRTQLLDLRSLGWDDDLLGWFGVDRSMLPALVPTAGSLGEVRHPRWGGSLPLAAMACDQQAALAGHGAFEPGAVKATFGTGVFVLANGGTQREPVDGLERSIAWSLEPAVGTLARSGASTMLSGAATSPTITASTTVSVLQGGVFTAGALLDWLRDDLALFGSVADLEAAAAAVPDAAGVRVLPALAGLGAPWWRPESRAVLAGLTAASDRGHIARAALDGIAHRVADVVELMAAALEVPPARIRVDGGLTGSEVLMQRQADLLGLAVDVASAAESTALGIAGLAGIGAGRLDASVVKMANPVGRTFEPRLDAATRSAERARWRDFVAAASAL